MAVAVDVAPSENTGTGLTATSTAITYAAGATIVFTVTVLANRTVATPTDSNGLTWNSIVNNTTLAGSGRVVYSWSAYAATGGTTTISATISSTGTPSWVTQRMSATGVDSVTPIDVTDNSQSGTGLSSPFSMSSGLTTAADCLIVGCSCATSKAYTADTGNGFTIGNASATTQPFQYKVGSSLGGTLNVTWSAGTVSQASIAFSLKAAAGASSSGPVFGRGRTFNNSRTMGGSTI